MKELDANVLNFLKSWYGTQNQEVFELMKLSVGRILMKDIYRGVSFDVDAPNPSFQHIYDWLSVAVENNESWLLNVDAQGRPKKLMKLSTIEQAVQEADKAMRKANQRLGNLMLEEGHEAIYAELDGGYSIVRMLTPEALDNESVRMQHCIGHGSYDGKLRDSSNLYLSLRDRHGKPHITFEISVANDRFLVHQMYGKQNLPPASKYLRVMDNWTDLQRLEFDKNLTKDFLFDTDGKIYAVSDLPDGFVARSDVVFGTTIKHLPRSLHALKDVAFFQSEVKSLPEGWIVEGSLVIWGNNFSEIPAGTVVKEDFHARGVTIDNIGDACSFGSLSLEGGKVKKIGSGVKIDGKLSIEKSNIQHFPSDIQFKDLFANGSSLKDLPVHIRKYGYLNIVNTAVEMIPEGVVVDELDFSKTRLRNLPVSLTINHRLIARSAEIKAVHGSWKLLGDVDLSDSLIEKMTGTITVEGHVGIDLSGTVIRKLPDAIIADCGTVSFRGAHIKKLPKKVHCVTLDLRGCDLKMDRLPEFDIQCQTVIINKSQSHMQLPKSWKVMNVTVKAGGLNEMDFVIKDASAFQPKKTAKPKFARERRKAAA